MAQKKGRTGAVEPYPHYMPSVVFSVNKIIVTLLDIRNQSNLLELSHQIMRWDSCLMYFNGIAKGEPVPRMENRFCVQSPIRFAFYPSRLEPIAANPLDSDTVT